MAGLLTTLSGVGKGISNTMPAFRERQQQEADDRQKALNAEYFQALNVASQQGVEAVDGVLGDPKFQQVSAEVQQRGMMLREKLVEREEQKPQRDLIAAQAQQAQRDLVDQPIVKQAQAMGVTEQSAQALPDAGRSGRGLDAIMRANTEIRDSDEMRRIKLETAKRELQNVINKGNEDDTPSPSQNPRGKLDDTQQEVTALLSRGEMSPEAALQRVQQTIKNFDIELDPEELVEMKTAYGEFLMRPMRNISQEQKKKVTAAETVQILSDRVLDGLERPEVLEALGRLQGAGTAVLSWITGKQAIPTEVVGFLQTLGFANDFISRKQSGAALTETEIRFYRDLVGSVGTAPQAIRQQMLGLIQALEEEKLSIYRQPFFSLYPNGIPEDVESKLPRFQSQHEPQQQGGGTHKWNPDTGQYEVQ